MADSQPNRDVPDVQGEAREDQTAEWSAERQADDTLLNRPPPPETLSQSSLGAGHVFGRYRIVKTLGQGGMGTVFLAHDGQLDREVALKIPKFTEDIESELVQRFYREARAMATVQHPNLCPIYDVGEIDGVHYLTMAYVDGKPLSKHLQSGRIVPNRKVAGSVRKLALALEEAHKHGVIHRDLKPANIMINRKGDPVIMDFGLARRDQFGEEELTHSGAIMGTPAYMSPEQVDGDLSKIGPTSDIYSLGVIMYQMMTGQLPFQGSVGRIMAHILMGNATRPAELLESVDPQLEAICLKAMARESEGRYSSGSELASVLANYIRGESVSESVSTDTSWVPDAFFDELVSHEQSQEQPISSADSLPGASTSQSLEPTPAAEDGLSKLLKPVAVPEPDTDGDVPLENTKLAEIWRVVSNVPSAIWTAGIVAGAVLLIASFFLPWWSWSYTKPSDDADYLDKELNQTNTDGELTEHGEWYARHAPSVQEKADSFVLWGWKTPTAFAALIFALITLVLTFLPRLHAVLSTWAWLGGFIVAGVWFGYEHWLYELVFRRAERERLWHALARSINWPVPDCGRWDAIVCMWIVQRTLRPHPVACRARKTHSADRALNVLADHRIGETP